MLILKGFILLTLAGIVSSNCRSVNNDKIEQKSSCNCTIKNNGRLVNDTSLLYYGLVQYTCNGLDGYLISKLKCNECGLYCVQNDLIIGCQNNVLQITLGLLVGVMISACIFFVIKWKLTDFVVRVMVGALIRRQHRHDIKTNKRTKFIEDVTGRTSRPVYKDLHRISDEHMEIANTHRQEDFEPELNNYIQLGQAIRGLDREGKLEANEISDKEIKSGMNDVPEKNELMNVENKTNNSRYCNSCKNSTCLDTVILSLICLCLLTPIQCCDMTFYSKTDGKLCSTEACFDMNMFEFPIKYGSSVCFKDSNDEVTEFKMSKCHNRIRMNKVYYVGSP